MFLPLTVPSAPPQDVQTPSSGENWVRISWQPPLKGNRNGNLTRYTVYYSTERSKDTASSLIAQPGQIHFRIPNLKPYTTYFVWVSASTNIGEGPLSSAIRATTAESGRYQKVEQKCISGLKESVSIDLPLISQHQGMKSITPFSNWFAMVLPYAKCNCFFRIACTMRLFVVVNMNHSKCCACNDFMDKILTCFCVL